MGDGTSLLFGLNGSGSCRSAGQRSAFGRCSSRGWPRSRPVRTAGSSAPRCTPARPSRSRTCPTAHRWWCAPPTPGRRPGEGAPRRGRMRPHPNHQLHRQLDGEHRGRRGHRRRAASGGAVEVSASLALRQPEPVGQGPSRVRDRGTGGDQVSGGVDPDGEFVRPSPAAANHDINILSDMSHTVGDTRWSLQPSVTQRHLEAEVAHCVGGVIAEPCGLPRSRATRVPSGCRSGATSDRRT